MRCSSFLGAADTSAPFPAYGTGEAAVAELSDGRIYSNTRRDISTGGLNPLMRHIAWSCDGSATWQDLSVSSILPDSPQDLPLEGQFTGDGNVPDWFSP